VPAFVLSAAVGNTVTVTPLAGQFFVLTSNPVVVEGTPVTYKLALVDDSGRLTAVTRPLPSGNLSGAGAEIFVTVNGGAHGEIAYLQR
jgi:hypothetical protein